MKTKKQVVKKLTELIKNFGYWSNEVYDFNNDLKNTKFSSKLTEINELAKYNLKYNS
ncbi:hypothetical protein AVT43_gp75 [Polaribacter phage P12002L]|uniref:Uncharacterized protein n=2 Tax=Incheonvirus TaxID=2976977 RepID=A0A0F7IKN4_9CAUD|nr:hypothetical protein AVT42_gp77 [Polaribacter phage P12002S]YP_009209735.1 hypothetical protein AVT43_gp75 [Polaribacter phage P12002L]AKG94249.1 hypothetical protein P12002L_0075 [Polaribacter phage P12002L]AKG94333.1 hypothetical protein P12002S_0077 [Polaribacter phage P12002S]